MKEPLKVLVVDDHPIARHGIMQVINQEDGLQTCGEAESAGQALEIIHQVNPDLAVIDISLKDSSGLTLIKNIRTLSFDMKILVVSMHEESLYAERALRAGAQGYITKQEAVEKIITAIKEIAGGGIYLSQSLSSQVIKKAIGSCRTNGPPGVKDLSDRELEVFQQLGKGLSTRQIAENLCLSIKTIETYRANIKEKLGLQNASQLVRQAVEWVSSRERT